VAFCFGYVLIRVSHSEDTLLTKYPIACMYNSIYHIFGSDYAEFAPRNMGDVTITFICPACKKCITISECVKKKAYQ
jgi:hypothetical protein